MEPVIPPIRLLSLLFIIKVRRYEMLLSAVLCVTKVSSGLKVCLWIFEKAAMISICSFFWKELAMLSVMYASAFTFDRSMNVTTGTEGFTSEYFSMWVCCTYPSKGAYIFVSFSAFVASS